MDCETLVQGEHKLVTERAKVKREIKEMRIREVRKIAVNLILKQQKNTQSKKIKELTKEQVLKRDDYECVLCNDKEDLQVHHFKPRLLRKNEYDGWRVTLCKYCHWYLHANPKYMIHHSNLVKSAMIKTNKGVYSYKGNKWGRRELSTQAIKKIIKLRIEGKTMREISRLVQHLDKSNRMKNVSIGVVHKIINRWMKNERNKNKY